MIRDYERSLEFAEMMHPAAEPAKGRIGRKQVLCRNAADREHNLGLQQCNLSSKVRQAGLDLLGPRVAVVRRAALEHVGDVDIGPAIEPDGPPAGIEELTRRPDEGLAAPVLLRSWSFADHQPVGPLRPDPEHALRARGMQWAEAAGAHLIEGTLPLRVDFRGAACRRRYGHRALSAGATHPQIDTDRLEVLLAPGGKHGSGAS